MKISGRKQEQKKSFSLRTKMIAAFLCVSLLGVILVGAVSVKNIYTFSQRELERNSLANLKSAMENTQDLILSLRSEAIRPIIEPTRTTAVVDLLTTGKTDYENMFDLQMQLSKSKAVSDVDSLFYLNEDHVITYQNGPQMSLAYMMEQPWFAQWHGDSRPYAWGPTYSFQGTRVVPYVRKIYSGGNVIGVCVLNIKEGAIRGRWNSYGNIVLLNGNNDVLSARDMNTLGKSFAESYGVELADIPSGRMFNVTHQGNDYYGILYRDSVYDMSMVELLPRSTTGTILTDMLESTLMIVVAVVLICGILAVMLSNTITKPLRNVTELVDSLELDATDVELPVTTRDEVGMLMESINNMTRRLEISKEELLRVTDARRLAEYKAIQLQINPHFLYNTLSSINWFADQNQPENVKKVAESLSTLFRVSVNHGREMLHIFEEIQHVRCYLDIQMLRHRDEFSYQIDVDPEILSYYTIKIILQPLVENALYHGIRENGVAHGMIRVIGRRKGDNLEFLVTDNGNTSQAEIDRMNRVLQNPDSREDEGIGMLNVHNRIRYFYQNSYGLRYEKKGELTIARVELPVMEEAEEHV